MVAISRVKVEFSGSAIVGAGSASFFTTGQVGNLRTPLIALWNQLRTAMPASLSIVIPNSGEVLDDVTGDLTDVWTEGTAYTATGTSSAIFAKGVGMRLVWLTGGTTRNRRVRGSTYVVPLYAQAYDLDGTIESAVLAATRTNAENFVAATQSDFVIWTRPRPAPGGIGPATPGKSSGVTGSFVPDAVTTLRSRRV